MTHFKPF